MKKKKPDKFKLYLYVLGFLVSVTPLFLQWYSSIYQDQIVQSYQDVSRSIHQDTQAMYIQEAMSWNDHLFQTQEHHGLDTFSTNDQMRWDKILCFPNTTVFAHLEIPSIHLDVPIYHGVKDENLINGVGHVDKSSFPISSKSARSVILGHRGSAASQLFTRLDELDKDDLIYVHILDYTFAYKVIDTEIVEPKVVESYTILENQNLLTLVTCTPYGINSHRLVVHAKEIPYVKQTKDKIHKKIPSFRECIFRCIPFLFIVGFLLELYRYILTKD